MSDSDLRVGRVLRASTRGFVIGCVVLRPNMPAFGSLVRADARPPEDAVYGLIYDVRLEDDAFMRHFIGANPPEETVRDQRENRQVPIEVSVLTVGCSVGSAIHHHLPAQPPVALDWLYLCTDEEMRIFTSRFDYLRLALDAKEVPADELVAANLRLAADAHSEGTRESFLVDSGRELARLLSGDPVRLEGLLRRLQRVFSAQGDVPATP